MSTGPEANEGWPADRLHSGGPECAIRSSYEPGHVDATGEAAGDKLSNCSKPRLWNIMRSGG